MDDLPLWIRTHKRMLAMFVLLFAACWFVPLGWRFLVPSDEGRYAEMAREMFVTHDWITLRYNGYRYFEKPPLQTWANALTFAVFGIGEWQARLYTAFTGFAGVLLIGYTGARVFNTVAGICAAIVLASAPYWNLMGHFNTLDTGLSFWMEAALCAMLLAQRVDIAQRKRHAWMILVWASMALAVLSKGLIGLVLPGAVLTLYSVIWRDWALWKRLHPVSGSIVFLAIAAPWFVLVQARNPDFFHFFFITQQFLRYLTPEQHRPGPAYYFVPVLIAGFLPWLSIGVKSVRDALQVPVQSNGFSPIRLGLTWIVFIFVFFSASHSKLVSYVLPVAPAIALVIGYHLPRISGATLARHFLGYLVFFAMAGGGACLLSAFGDVRTPPELYLTFRRWVWLALSVAAILTAMALWLARSRQTHPAPEHDQKARLIGAITIYGFAWLLLGLIAGTGHNVFGRLSSGALLAPAIKAKLATLPPDTPFYSVDVLDHTMPFYIGHTMIMVRRKDELAFGIDSSPSRWVPTISAWIALWEHEPHALALMSPQRYAELAAQNIPMRVVDRDSRRVIVENH